MSFKTLTPKHALALVVVLEIARPLECGGESQTLALTTSLAKQGNQTFCNDLWKETYRQFDLRLQGWLISGPGDPTSRPHRDPSIPAASKQADERDVNINVALRGGAEKETVCWKSIISSSSACLREIM